MLSRDLPRRLAPLILGVGNIGFGVVGFISPERTAAYQKVPGDLKLWAVGFIALGGLILLGIKSWRCATVTGSIAVAAWTFWAYLVYKARVADPAHVTWKGVYFILWIAAIHFLLQPYHRRRRSVPARQ